MSSSTRRRSCTTLALPQSTQPCETGMADCPVWLLEPSGHRVNNVHPAPCPLRAPAFGGSSNAPLLSPFKPATNPCHSRCRSSRVSLSQHEVASARYEHQQELQRGQVFSPSLGARFLRWLPKKRGAKGIARYTPKRALPVSCSTPSVPLATCGLRLASQLSSGKGRESNATVGVFQRTADFTLGRRRYTYGRHHRQRFRIRAVHPHCARA